MCCEIERGEEGWRDSLIFPSIRSAVRSAHSVEARANKIMCVSPSEKTADDGERQTTGMSESTRDAI